MRSTREVRAVPSVHEWVTNGVVVRLLREELQLLHEPASYVGEIVKVMGKKKVLVKVQPEGKYSAYGLRRVFDRSRWGCSRRL
jgi:ATP-dependent 26S proteasome regulatory subunit